MNLRRMIMTLGLGMGVVLCGGSLMERAAKAQSSASPPFEGNLQRSTAINNFQTAAPSGPQRGEEIYFIKCWMCHNDYTIEARTGAPTLQGIYERPQLMSGQPVNDDTIAEKTREGGPMMPAYRYALSDADMVDLLSYLRDESCCFDGEEPPANPWYRAAPGQGVEYPVRNNKLLRGGPRGVVRTNAGEPLEGIMVQLISQLNSIRTTVYSNEQGQYEFPQLPTGLYTLRIARPMEFWPYRRDSVRIDGAMQLEEIVLKRVTESELLPPTPEILGQLTGADWMLNLPGTGQEKRVFANSCGFACHSYQQIFRNRYDEDSWHVMVEHMTRGAGSPLINVREVRRITEGDLEENIMFKWLAKARGPESEMSPLYVLPGPQGAATRVVVTEYELPRTLLSLHDVQGDSKSNLWYTPHRSAYVGKLDPRTGVVTEYRLPDTPGALPGTHAVWVDKNDVPWFSENWSHKLTKFDPQTEQFTQTPIDTPSPFNSPGFGSIALDPEGYAWTTRGRAVHRIDPNTGKSVATYPFKKMRSTYGNLISRDGNFWAGGQWPGNLIGLLDIRNGKLLEVETRSRMSSPSRGYFDNEGNPWFGGRGGALVTLNAKTGRAKEYPASTPYETFYEAMPDKNGEVWAGAQHGGRFVRFNPRTERWIEYVLPEPFGHNRRTWVDNSTDPVSVWYVDNNGYMVHIQPLE